MNKVKGVNEARSNLRRISAEVLLVLHNEREPGRLVYADATRRAPKKSGNLSRAYTYTIRATRRRVRWQVKTRQTGKGKYASFVEMGYVRGANNTKRMKISPPGKKSRSVRAIGMSIGTGKKIEGQFTLRHALLANKARINKLIAIKVMAAIEKVCKR